MGLWGILKTKLTLKGFKRSLGFEGLGFRAIYQHRDSEYEGLGPSLSGSFGPCFKKGS